MWIIGSVDFFQVALFAVDNLGTIGRVRALYLLGAFLAGPLPQPVRIEKTASPFHPHVGMETGEGITKQPVEGELLREDLVVLSRLGADENLRTDVVSHIIDAIRQRVAVCD